MVWRINEISSLTSREYIELKAALGAEENAEYQCDKCIKKYQGRSDAEDISRKSRDNKGCFTQKQIVIHKLDDLEFKICPGNAVSNWALYICELFANFQKGIMPFEGSFADQPNKLIEAFNVISDWNFKKLEERERKNGLRRNTIRNSRKIRGGNKGA